MTDFVTDTHASIWYLEDSSRLGVAARSAFNAYLLHAKELFPI